MLRRTLGLAALAATLALPAAAQRAHQATNWLAPAHILTEFPYTEWIPEVARATNNQVRFELHASGSLIPARATMQGIRDRVAAVGIVFPGYTPSELPLNNVVNDLVFVADDDMAAAFAWTELNFRNRRMQAEWQRNGGIFGGGYSTPLYYFICMRPVRTVRDLQGLKVRTAAGSQVEWVRSFGGTPVSVPIGDVYSGLQRGSIDCALSDATNLDRGNRFWEVARAVTRLPMGVVVGANWVYNTSFWRERTPEQRRALLDTMARAAVRAQMAYAAGVDAAIAGSRQRGLEIIDASPELRQRLAEFNRGFVDGLARSAMERYRAEDPSDVIREYLELEQRWKGLLAGIDRSNEAALVNLVRTELYGRVDERSYGLR